MADRKLNFNVPLLSTRRMQKTVAVSVRRNKLTDDSKTSDSPLLVPEVVTQVFTPCPPPGKVMEKAIYGNLTRTRFQSLEDDQDDDDVFSDALDTLHYPKGSSSINHSISGVSGYGLSKPPTEDPQSLDFMLNRFLPAAKAMTLDLEPPPHYSSNRKPSTFMPEPTLQIRPQQTSNRYDNSIQDIDDDEQSKDDDDNDDVTSEYANLSKRGCGMLPQLCFKESLSMLNTLPGFKAKPNSPLTSPSHDQVKSSKAAQLKSRFHSVKKMALDSVSKHNKLSGKVQSPVHQNLSVASRSSSPYRNSRSMSPFCSRGNSSPLHPETRKETENLRANRLNKHIRNISTSQELLYPKSNSSTSSNVIIISPKESDKAGKIQDANLKLDDASENITSGKMVKGDDELGKMNERFSLAPPSPKKPSESWLFHNLPSLKSHNPLKQDLTENSRKITKWETIVKTSNMHRDHIRYSQELVAHQSKT